MNKMAHIVSSTMKATLICLFAVGAFSIEGLGQVRPTVLNEGEVKVTPTQPARIDRARVGPIRAASRPAFGMLIILTEPENAEIRIDGRPAGRAVGGKWSKELPSGKRYNITVSAGPDYEPFKDVRTLRSRDPEIIEAALPSKYGVVNIFPAMEGVKILIDGQPPEAGRLKTDKERQTIIIENLSPGAHKITYDLPEHVLYERTFNIAPGSVHAWNFIPKRAVAEMTVATQPDTAVYVDGEQVGKTPTDGRLIYSNVKIGPREIKLVKEGYEEYKQTIRFEFGKPVRVEPTLVPLPTSAEFSDDFEVPSRIWSVPPSGVSVRSGRLNIDGTSVVVYPRSINYRNFVMHFHLKLVNAGGAAWVVRAKDPNSYYLFYLSGPQGLFPNRFVTYVVRDNKFDPRNPDQSVQVIARLRAGGEYEIDIKATGNKIEHDIKPAETGASESLGFFEDRNSVFQYGGIGFRTVSSEKFSIDDLYVQPR